MTFPAYVPDFNPSTAPLKAVLSRPSGAEMALHSVGLALVFSLALLRNLAVVATAHRP